MGIVRYKSDGSVARQRLGETQLSRQQLTAALEPRHRPGHGRIAETRRALALLPPTAV